MEICKKRKRVEPFVPLATYLFIGGDPQRQFTNIVVQEMEKKIQNILEKKEQDAANAKNLKNTDESGNCVPKQPDYLWLMDCRLKERKILKVEEYSRIEKIIEKTNMNDWTMIVALFAAELEKVTTRNDVIQSFEDVVQTITTNKEKNQSFINSVNDIVISMSQLLDNEELETDPELDTCSIETTSTGLSFDTLKTSDNDSVQLLPDAKSKYDKVMNTV